MTPSLKIYLLLCLLLPVCLFSQSIKEVENNYQRMIKKLTQQQQSYDSLSTVYKAETKRISDAKESGSNQSEKLMAQAILTSNSLSDLQKSITVTREHITQTRKDLFKLYGSKIDSLKLIEKQEKDNPRNELLNVEILSLIEKRFAVAAEANTLAYLPDQISKINLSEISDSLEKKLYSEYLSNAILEVDEQLTRTTEQIEKLDEILTLQNKVQEFIEDIGFENDAIKYQASTGNKQTTKEATREPGAGFDTDMNSAFDNSLKLYNQLNLFAGSSQLNNRKIPVDLTSTNFSNQEYLELLIELVRRLNNYKGVLENNLKSKDD